MLSEVYERALEVEQMHGDAVFQLRYAKKQKSWTALFTAKAGKRPFFYKGSDKDKERAIEKAIQSFIQVAKAAAEAREAEEKAKREAEEAEKAALEAAAETSEDTPVSEEAVS